jgi:hypothetical protein
MKSNCSDSKPITHPDMFDSKIPICQPVEPVRWDYGASDSRASTYNAIDQLHVSGISHAAVDRRSIELAHGPAL